MDLGKFEVIEELGKGGFGIVYLALDKVLDRQIALKVLHPELLINPNFILRFKQEAQLSARLDHPNILPVYDFGEFEGRYYIVMAYMPDGSLKDLLRKEGKLDKQRSLKIFEQICDGMNYAHSQKIIHRDLKPGNILFDSRGNPRISDMGFAKLIHSDNSASMSSSGRMVGTPSYMAPEIWQGKPATSATDVYSLACVLVEMLTGQTLFAGETTPEIMMKHFAPLYLTEDLPDEWKPVLESALKKNPEERIQTVGDFFEQIKAVELGLNEAEKIAPKKSDEDKPKKEKRSRFIDTKRNKKEPSYSSEKVESTLGISKDEQSTESGEENHIAEIDAQKTKRIESTSAEDEKKPVLPESKERKGKPGLKAGVIAGIALLAIIIGVIIFQIGKTNSPSPTPVIVDVPVTATATNTAVLPTKTTTNTPAPTATTAATETPAATATEAVLGIGSMRIRSMDGMEQVYVPAGDFIMGSNDNDADSDEKPIRTVYLDSYWIDKYEVSNGQYQECVTAGACAEPQSSKSYTRSSYYGNAAYDDYPVIYVDWNQTKAYCEWVGGDLPTEAQWERAAKGDDGRNYPWGNKKPDSSYANYNENIGDTTEVGSYVKGVSPYEAMDMAGNVSEWVKDWYGNYVANDSNDSKVNNNGEYKIVRGGSWINNDWTSRTTYRDWYIPENKNFHLGFRCVSSIATEAATETPAATATEAVLGIGSTQTREIDEMEQVYVPEGDFIMGSDDSDSYINEIPVRKIYLDAYWIDKYEVTNLQYEECVENGACTKPQENESYSRDNYFENSSFDDYPVINVNWHQAKAYCEWAGGDLPTEAQWEKAARGDDARKYPWGDQEPDSSRAHYNKYPNVRLNAVGLKPDGSSLYGAMDMAGNAEEWVNDWYGEYDAINTNNPKGSSDTSEYRVLRGGSQHDHYRNIRTTFRSWGDPNSMDGEIGFRCVSSIVTEAATETSAATATEVVLGIGSTQIRDKDKMEQVYVPAGNFIMGSKDGDADAKDDEKPEKIVYLDSYWIDKYEVSNGQYQKCVARGACSKPEYSDSSNRSNYYGNSAYDNYPVMYVDWYQSKAYCDWVGGDLPTEAQWEKAARGEDGRKYPWGNEPPDTNKAHIDSDDTAEVGSKPAGASPYGALDMIGNVEEWANYWYTYNHVLLDTNNPQGPYSGRFRVFRGGSHYYTVEYDMRAAQRSLVGPGTTVAALGFRCVSSP